MDLGYVIKRDDNDFVINVDPATYEGGYNVVPKSIDPYNAYEIEDVKTYIIEHPEMLIPEETIQKNETKKTFLSEIATLKQYLAETDWIHNKCTEAGLDVNVKYADMITERRKARGRINELEALLEAYNSV